MTWILTAALTLTLSDAPNLGHNPGSPSHTENGQDDLSHARPADDPHCGCQADGTEGEQGAVSPTSDHDANIQAAKTATGREANDPHANARAGQPETRAAADNPHAGHQAGGMKDRIDEIPLDTQNVGIDDSRLDELLTLDVELRDEDERPVALETLFDGDKPVLLTFVYFRCSVICKPLLEFLASALSTLELTAGTEFRLITVSIDPGETRHLTKLTKQRLLSRYGRPAAEWWFLRGSQEEIARLADAAGFKYNRVAGTNEFAHPASLIILTPDGRIARYLPGIPENPARHAKDIKLSLIEAADGKVGNAIDWFVLTCYHFDPTRGTYTVQAQRVMVFTGGVTVFFIAVLVVPRWWRDSRRSRPRSEEV